MNKIFYDNWKKIREKGLVKFIFSRYLVLGLIIGIISPIINNYVGYLWLGDNLADFSVMLPRIVVLMIIGVLFFIIAGLIIWFVNERLYVRKK